MQRVSGEHIHRVLAEQEIPNLDLEKRNKQLDSWSMELNKSEAYTEHEKQKLDEKKNKNDVRKSSLQLASLEQKMADGNHFGHLLGWPMIRKSVNCCYNFECNSNQQGSREKRKDVVRPTLIFIDYLSYDGLCQKL